MRNVIITFYDVTDDDIKKGMDAENSTVNLARHMVYWLFRRGYRVSVHQGERR